MGWIDADAGSFKIFILSVHILKLIQIQVFLELSLICRQFVQSMEM